MANGVKLNLKDIFCELCKGNLGILSLDVVRYISDRAVYLYTNINYDTKAYNDELKDLIMICNLLYNRTSMDVLPVEDGLYDILLERYKMVDPHFQVGSAVVQFEENIQRQLMSKGEKPIVCPIRFIEKKEKSEINQMFADNIISFDLNDVYNYNDAFYDKVEYTEEDMKNISKRLHDTEHNHPDLVGTLDKCKFVLDADAMERDVYGDPNVKILERDWFVKHLQQGIIKEDEELEIILELKYDGISVEADCTDEVISARTRGDTGIGKAADITPLLKGYKFTRNQALKDRVVGVKFEAIMTKYNLYQFNQARGKDYKNCRTAIIGLFGASDGWKYRDFITLVPLAVDRANVPEISCRLEEEELLNRVYKTKCEPLRYCVIHGNYKTCLYLIKKYAEEAVAARDYLDFMFDGIVVSYADERIRKKLGRENNINKFQMAVKFDPSEKVTTFLGYTFEVGQNGTVCPMIHYAPVEFFGTIHNKSTGSSYKRFLDMNLREGDQILVTYNNDVMPYVSTITCEHNNQNKSKNKPVEFPKVCPECGAKLEISASAKTAICPNIDCIGRKVSRMTNMLQKLNLKGFAESTIRQLGIYTFHQLFKMSIDDLQILGPTNASNFYNAMKSLKETPIEEYRIIGALGFTNVGQKTWKLIFSAYTLAEFIKCIQYDTSHFYNTICNIKGIGSSIADVIINEYNYFKDDIDYINQNFNILDSMRMSYGKQIRFTGCRNAELENMLRSLGHDADGSAGVTKKTDILIVPYDGYSSSKTAKVSDSTIVVPIGEFMEDMDKYL